MERNNLLEKYFPFLIFVIVFVAFTPSLANRFVDWDDAPLILFNNDFRGLGIANLKWMFSTFHMSHYQPLTWLSLAIDYCLWGLNPFGYHLTNILLHSLAAAFLAKASLMLFRIGRLGYSTSFVGAFFAALFFAVHPLRAESVSWLTERRDVLSTCLFLMAIWSYIRACLENTSQKGILSSKRLVPCFFLYVCACFSKSMAVTLPAVLLLLDFYPLKRISMPLRKDFLPVLFEKIPFFAFAAALSLFYYFVVGKYIDIPYTQAYMPSAAKAIYAYWFYLLKTFVPIALSPVYVPPEGGYFLPNMIGGIVLLLLTGFAFAIRQKIPAFLTALLFYFGTLFPACGLLNGAPVPAADRYSYIPSIGIAVFLGFAFACLFEKGRFRKTYTVLAVSILVLIAGLNVRQQRFWKGSTSVWNRVVSVEPRSAIAYNNLASLVYAKGDIPQAEELMLKAKDLAPDDFNINFNCANMYAMSGEYEKALTEYDEVLRKAPTMYEAYIRKADMENKLGKYASAEKTLIAATGIRPDYFQAWHGLAIIRLETQDFAGAEAALKELLRIMPDMPEAKEMLEEARAGQLAMSSLGSNLQLAVSN